MIEAKKTVWHGPRALRRFLVPIDSLEPFPGNPRIGDVEELRASLRRFGQVMPILTDPKLGEDRRSRIVARHHLVLAAAAEGWTHVAAIPNEFDDEDEARAYLLADNRLGERGSYNLDALTEHLGRLAELDRLEGTGYTRDDLADRLDELRALSRETPARPPEPPVPPPEKRELVLHYDAEQYAQIEAYLTIVSKEKGTTGPAETIYAALETAARTLHAGT